MNLFKRQPKLERPAPALNDSDLEALQQQRIQAAGHTNAQKTYRTQWTATDADGSTGEVDPDVYRRDDA